jgi:hypothetical protein
MFCTFMDVPSECTANITFASLASNFHDMLIRMRRNIAFLALFLLLFAPACAKNEKQTAEAPADVTWTMQNRILQSAALGFSLTAPAGFEWTSAERREKDVYTFSATGNNAEVRLTVYDRPHERVTKADVQALIDAMKPTYEAAGITMRHTTILPEETAKMGWGYLYYLQVRAGTGDPAMVHGFVTARARLYQLEKTSTSMTDANSLTPFIRGLTPIE